MAMLDYQATLVPPDSAWSRLRVSTRKRLTWALWAITWLGLVAGCFDVRFWRGVVWFSLAHALLALALVGFRWLAFPAQLRLAYVAWVAIGTYVPFMSWMMYVTLVGLAANLAVGWCPLSRMLYLLPWNREEPWDSRLPLRVFLSGPVEGRFHAPPAPARVQEQLHPHGR
jgi:hypothetical protein